MSMNNHSSPKRPPIIDYEGSDYQTTFWDEGGRDYEDQVEAIALKRLLPEGGDLLLEVGAGAGRNTPRYQGFERVVLLDYSMSQLRQAQNFLGRSARYIYVAADVYRLPFVAGIFDGATMIRTIHHMADAPRALGQIRNALGTGAIFILEYANKHNGKAIFRYALRRQNWSPFTLEPVEFVELNFDFHPQAVRNWLCENAFEVERQLTVSHFRMQLLKKVIPANLLIRMDSLAQLTGDWWQLTPSVFVRSRAVGKTPPWGPGRTPGASPGEIFRCPECGHSPLKNTNVLLICEGCSSKWGINDGIYDFREPAAG